MLNFKINNEQCTRCGLCVKDYPGLPRDHIYYPMMFGIALVHYTRTVQRDSVAKINRITM